MLSGAQVFLKFISVLGAGEGDEREELRKMQAIFQSFDTNADGEIDIDGGLVAARFCTVCHRCGAARCRRSSDRDCLPTLSRTEDRHSILAEKPAREEGRR